MTKNDYIEKITQNLEHLTKDELKDVSILTNAQLGVRSKFAERQQLEHEIANLTPQLQQQALPVVPECVGIAIKQLKNDQLSLYGALNAILSDMTTEIYAWISKGNQNAFARAWLDGYTVEKPQLFYLKNKITGKYLRSYTGLSMDDRTLRYEEVKDKRVGGFGGGTTFTQSEIDSMQTGSYELVPVEDGE